MSRDRCGGLRPWRYGPHSGVRRGDTIAILGQGVVGTA